MTNNLQNPDLQTSKTTSKGILGQGAEKYIRDTANIEDLPGDDDDLEIDDEEDDDIDATDNDDEMDDADKIELAKDDAAIDDEEDEDYINKDEAKRDLEERGLRP